MRFARRLIPVGMAPRLASVVRAVLLLAAVSLSPCLNPALSCASAARDSDDPHEAPPPAGSLHAGHIREFIPGKYLKRYLRWKSEYLATEAGRRQWERYDRDDRFTLTINISPALGQGGLVSDYRWDASGKLVAATITLGSGLDKGLLSPLYYPVTSAVVAADERLGEDILAAAKFAHEFGHVNRAAETDAALFQQQNRLAASYARIFEESGYNINDPRLVEITRLMGSTPYELKRERELDAEANALVFLRERISHEEGSGAILRKIRKSLREYGGPQLKLLE